MQTGFATFFKLHGVEALTWDTTWLDIFPVNPPSGLEKYYGEQQEFEVLKLLQSSRMPPIKFGATVTGGVPALASPIVPVVGAPSAKKQGKRKMVTVAQVAAPGQAAGSRARRSTTKGQK